LYFPNGHNVQEESGVASLLYLAIAQAVQTGGFSNPTEQQFGHAKYSHVEAPEGEEEPVRHTLQYDLPD
jgi:hypothetical protein